MAGVKPPFQPGQFVWSNFPYDENPLRPGPKEHIAYVADVRKMPDGSFLAVCFYTTSQASSCVSKAHDWLDRADVDLDLAEIALQQKIPRLEGAAYSVQQAAEKTIQAILQHLGIKIPKSHDITELVSSIPARHHLIKQASALEPTTPWSIQSRYPSFETVPPAIPDRKTLQQMTKNIRQLQESLSIELPKPITPFVISLKQSASIGQN